MREKPESVILDNRHFYDVGYRQRITTSQLRYILLNGMDGSCYTSARMKRRYLGAGIYEIWFEYGSDVGEEGEDSDE